MNIDFKMIKEKCPKAYKMFKDYYQDDWCNFCGTDLSKCDCDKDSDYSLRDVCYCDFEKFFDEDQGIIIIICLHDEYEAFVYTIYSKKESKIIFESDFDLNWKMREEAKEQAIYKAFKILEKKLSGVK